MLPCECTAVHQPRRVVLTGGPGAGKTATLEMIKQSFCDHVRVLPAASVVFGGGFPRPRAGDGLDAAQRATFYVQRDARILNAWDGHPHRVVVENTSAFLQKAARVVDLIRAELPTCCRTHKLMTMLADPPRSAVTE
jgi:hypothetical protein